MNNRNSVKEQPGSKEPCFPWHSQYPWDPPHRYEWPGDHPKTHLLPDAFPRGRQLPPCSPSPGCRPRCRWNAQPCTGSAGRTRRAKSPPGSQNSPGAIGRIKGNNSKSSGTLGHRLCRKVLRWTAFVRGRAEAEKTPSALDTRQLCVSPNHRHPLETWARGRWQMSKTDWGWKLSRPLLCPVSLPVFFRVLKMLQGTPRPWGGYLEPFYMAPPLQEYLREWKVWSKRFLQRFVNS